MPVLIKDAVLLRKSELGITVATQMLCGVLGARHRTYLHGFLIGEDFVFGFTLLPPTNLPHHAA